MLCVNPDSNGVLVAVAKTACDVGDYLVLTAAELESVGPVSPFDLGMNEAGQIAGAVMLIWSLGFGIRMAIRALNGGASSAVDELE